MVPNEEKQLPQQPELPVLPPEEPVLNLDALDVDQLLASFREEAEADRSLNLSIDEVSAPVDFHPEEDAPVPPQIQQPPEEAPLQEPDAPVEETPSQPVEQQAEPSPESTPQQEPVAPTEEEDPQPQSVSPAAELTAEAYLIDTMANMGLEGSTPRKKRRKRHPHFFYYIAEAFRGIFGHGFMSFAAVTIITACLIIMGTFSLIALNVNNEISTLMDNNEFLAYVNEDYSTEEALALQSQIQAIENVSEVTFITRQEAYESYVDAMEDSSLYADLDPDTVFRDRFSVKVENLEEVEATADQVLAITGIDDISIDVDIANGFITLRNIVLMVAAVLVSILFIISLFIISNTIKLVTVSRQEEIAIMRMVGATSRFIRWPFIYQGAILGLVGSGIAFGLQTGLYIGISNAITRAGQSTFTVELIAFHDLDIYLLGVFLIAGLIIGVFGSSIAIRKFLRV